ncbi:MAG TPA: thiamine ABC transporter substrate-binding protein, partial [Spirochaetia bacterium]|nr:thiamine ABC transporter substrate-binding protein [Spirochaetia bacterium]
MVRRWILVLACAAALSAPLAAQTRVLRVLTHSSFAASQSVLDAFQQANDVKLQFISGGDAGEALNKAILARGNPLADVFYGVDNTFLSRALEADILQPYDSPSLAQIPAGLRLDASNRLLPVDFGYVDLNYDPKYFADKGLTTPQTLEDLTLPAYRGLL